MDEYDDGPYWVILLMYGSHDMRHTGFRRLTVVNGTLGFLLCHTFKVRALFNNSYHFEGFTLYHSFNMYLMYDYLKFLDLTSHSLGL